MTNAIVPSSGVLQRMGTPQERQYLMELLAEQLGIPAHEAGRADVVALLANAVQRSVQFGWLPGIHMHVQQYESTESKRARENNPNAHPIYTYTLVDGEKAWKDSAARWRSQYGIQWTYQRREMSREEIAAEAKLMGYTQAIAPNSFGYWCRIIENGIDDANDPDNPTWAAGVWFGKIAVGKYWRDDHLPSGNSSRDVALRRADKRALMQSRMSLLPVSGNSDEERMAQLIEGLRREKEHKDRMTSLPVTRPVQREPDGQILLSAPPKPVQTTQSDDNEDALDGIWEEADPVSVEPDDAFSPYASLIHNIDYDLSERAVRCIEYVRNLHRKSAEPMSESVYDYLCTLIDTTMDGDVHGLLIPALIGEVGVPGCDVLEISEWLSNKHKHATKLGILTEITNVCLQVQEDMETA